MLSDPKTVLEKGQEIVEESQEESQTPAEDSKSVESRSDSDSVTISSDDSFSSEEKDELRKTQEKANLIDLKSPTLSDALKERKARDSDASKYSADFKLNNPLLF